MISVTQEAGQFLHQMMNRSEAKEGQSLRLVQRDSGLGFAVDQRRQDDCAFAYDGQVVLVVEQKLVDQMSDLTLKVRAVQGSPALVLE